MVYKIHKERWNALVQEHLNGKTLAQIVRENDDVKKSALRYHVKKARAANEPTQNEPDDKQGEDTAAPQKVEQVVEEPPSIPKPAAVKPTAIITKKRAAVQDDFLHSFAPEQFKQAPRSNSAVDQIFSINDIFQPETLQKPLVTKEKEKPLAGKSKSWWLSGKSEVQKKREKDLEDDNEQLVLVQKIRLYFTHFPELSKLHIVTRKRGTDEPDTEKWLISLYGKTQPELEKLLNFIKFHVRNNMSENSSVKLASNVLETSVKILEHVLLRVGVQSQDLTKDVMSDEDISRCVKEILIDHSVTSLNLGPKSDLLLKLGMKIVACDSHNRIEQQIEKQTKNDKRTDVPLSPSLVEKYKDL
jgi:hypothetical protein